jgi:hypothetical protein
MSLKPFPFIGRDESRISEWEYLSRKSLTVRRFVSKSLA